MSDDSADVEDTQGRSADNSDGVDAPSDFESDSEDGAARTGDGERSLSDTEVVPERLVSRVAGYDEELADAVGALESRLTETESELAETESELEAARETIDRREERIDDLEDKLRRSKADFQNYKKRTKRKQEDIKARATEDLVDRMTKVRDNLLRALEQDSDANIRPGIESTLEEFDRILEDENVAVIDPEPGDDVDPNRHEVMLRVESDEPAGTIVDVYQPGYEMAEKVLRPAQVTVSEDA
ncbi:MAG: nucleotide exchange factor GrpE [Halobacteriota archaeon]